MDAPFNTRAFGTLGYVSQRYIVVLAHVDKLQVFVFDKQVEDRREVSTLLKFV